MIAVVDYGAGNIRSVVNALEAVAAECHVTSDPDEVRRSPAVLLPGVGAAADTMEGLRRRGLDQAIAEAVQEGKPFLGVCIGLQVLLTYSEEAGYSQCLNIVPGSVKRLPGTVKVPHIGWNQVFPLRPHGLFAGIPEGTYFYFVHSYYAQPNNASTILAETEYGVTFPSALMVDNLMAVQFHPERSGRWGLKLYRNFVDIVLRS
jgi:glutamine amidotransferase